MDEQTAERMEIVARYLGISILASGRAVEREQFKAEATAWTLALNSIPVRHLEECFKRAIQDWVSEFPMPAAAVNKVYRDLIQELQARVQAQGNEDERLLLAGGRRPGDMTFTEWKAFHNLPANWRGTNKLPDLSSAPYPPESDLYGKVGHQKERFYDCFKCKDSGWARIPFDAKTASGPTLVMCECGRAGNPRGSE